MNWSDLLPELEEVVLAKLSLFDLARVSATCRVFQATFRSQLQDEQKLRCNLAVACFGRERIACIVELIQRVLTGEALNPVLYRTCAYHQRCRMSEEGAFHLEEPAASLHATETPHGTQSVVQAYVHPVGGKVYGVTITALAPHGSRVELWFWRHLDRCMIRVLPSSDEDLEGVAMAQALVDGGLGGLPRQVGIHIVGEASRAGLSPTMSGFKRLIAPLMPLGPTRPCEGEWAGKKVCGRCITIVIACKKGGGVL
jgi:hypothetical protein